MADQPPVPGYALQGIVNALQQNTILLGQLISAVTTTLGKSLTSGHIYVGNASNVAADVAMSGDIAITDTGVTTVEKIQGTAVGGTSGTGDVAFTVSPGFTTPAIGAATATSVNKVAITAPANGSTLTVADGKTLTASNTVTLTGTDGQSLNISAVLIRPQGRLTLVSGTPVMISDQTAKSVIYYTPYQGDVLPIYNGAQFGNTVFPEVSVTLDAANAVSGNLYDLFVYNDSGAIRLGYGPAWTNTTTRSAAISMLGGIWVNTSGITLRYDSTHTSSAAANQASYVGTFYATANGQTGMAFTPTPALGGTNNILGLYNAYNRVLVIALNMDSTSSWTYATATWRPSNNSTSNRVSWVDGLAQSSVRTQRFQLISLSSATGYVALGFNSTSAPSGGEAGSNSSATISMGVFAASQPLLGFNYVQSLEYATGGTASYFGGGNMEFGVTLEM